MKVQKRLCISALDASADGQVREHRHHKQFSASAIVILHSYEACVEALRRSSKRKLAAPPLPKGRSASAAMETALRGDGGTWRSRLLQFLVSLAQALQVPGQATIWVSPQVGWENPEASVGLPKWRASFHERAVVSRLWSGWRGAVSSSGLSDPIPAYRSGLSATAMKRR